METSFLKISGARGKKMIPIVIAETPKLSPLLRHLNMLHYTTCGDPKWFWERLEHSVRSDIVMIGEQEMAKLRQVTCEVRALPGYPMSPDCNYMPSFGGVCHLLVQ